MTTLTLLLSILGALLLGAMSPGPSFVLVSRTALARSRGAGLAAALGMGAGGFLFALLALLGLIALLESVPWLYLALKVAGGLYLISLGIRIWRGAKEPLGEDTASGVEQASLMRSFSIGFITQVANPKTAVVYASIFAVFLPSSPSSLLLLLIPPGVFLIEFGWYALVALLFSARRPRAAYLSSKHWIDRAAGVLMGALGARLVVDADR